MNNDIALRGAAHIPDAYTDLQGLQRLRNNPDKDEALRQVAQQFESLFLSMMLKNMRQANAAFEQDSLFNNSETHLIRDMYDNQLSLNLAQGSGTGLAEVLYRQLSGQYGDKQRGAESISDAASQQWRRVSAVGSPLATAGATQQASAQRAALTETPADFIETVMPHARAAAEQLGVDASVLVAQAALETGWGRRVLADERGASTNNLFNIKANGAWQGDTVAVNALEYRDGVAVREQSQFKKYASLADSFDDFVSLVKDNPRYAGALKSGANAADFVQSLHQAGYATDPLYTDKVMSVYADLERDVSNSSSLTTSSTGGLARGEG